MATTAASMFAVRADLAPRIFQNWGKVDDGVLLKIFLSRLPLSCQAVVRDLVFETDFGRYLTCEITMMRLQRETCLLNRRLDGDMQEMMSPTGASGRETPFFTPSEPVDDASAVDAATEAAEYLQFVPRESETVHDCSSAALAMVVARLPAVTRRLVEWHALRAATLLAQAHRVFRPGVRFDGQIKVPGIEDYADDDVASKPSVYEMTVLYWGKTIFGRPVIYVSHEAYEDRQACDVDVTVVRGRGGAFEVKVDYRDGETICSGVLDVQAGRIAGNVRQLEYGEEGFEYPAQEVTHTFQLSVVPEGAGVVKQRAAVIAARRECAQALGIWRPESYDHLPRARVRTVAWSNAFDAAVAESEVTLAELRNKTRVLRDLKFTTPAERKRTIGVLESEGCTREAAHAVIDIGLLGMRQAVLLPDRLSVAADPIDEPTPPPFPGLAQRHEFHKMLIRGSDCYHKFDEALGSASKRIPQSIIEDWVVEGGAPDAECAICIMEIDEDDALVTLPCKHNFHKECILEWAHTSSVCPNCRSAMQATNPETGSPCP